MWQPDGLKAGHPGSYPPGTQAAVSPAPRSLSTAGSMSQWRSADMHLHASYHGVSCAAGACVGNQLQAQMRHADLSNQHWGACAVVMRSLAQASGVITQSCPDNICHIEGTRYLKCMTSTVLYGGGTLQREPWLTAPRQHAC